jgi:hypothetical protein
MGIDLDDHRNPDTGELTPFAQKVLGLFPSYAEVSPSGTGIKIFGRGKLPAGCPKQNKSLGVEVYDGGRYFTVTGNVIPGGPTEIQNLQPAIDQHLGELLGIGHEPKTALTPALGDQGHRETPRPSANGTTPTVDDVERRVRRHAEGQRLMDGDTTAHGNDESAADLALCNLIAFYTGDNPNLIDEVFRRSRLMRSKWCEKHARDGRTYGELTVGKAIAGKSQFYDWSKPSRISIEASENAGPDPPTLPQVIELPWPQMAPAAYHGLAGEFVYMIQDKTESDPVALLLQLAVSFGNAAGRSAFRRVEFTQHYGNENLVIVGQSAKARKGTAWNWIDGLFRLADPEWVAHRHLSGIGSGEGLIYNVRDAVTKTGDSTPGVHNEGIADKRLLIQESEFASILRVIERPGNTLSALLRTAWDGGVLRNTVKNSPLAATNPHISIIGHITTDELLRLLTATEVANGFGNRILFALVRRRNLLPFGGDVAPRLIPDLAARLSARIRYAQGVGEVSYSQEAAEMWIALYPHLSRDRYGLFGTLTNRAEAHVTRLALLFTLLDGVSVIRPEHLHAALAVWEYCEASVRHIFGDAIGNPLADQIRGFLRSCPLGMTRTEISTALGRNVRSADIDEALGALHRAGLAQMGKRGNTGGKPAEVWVAVV